MAQVQFADEPAKIRITKRMAAPTKASNMLEWLKGARKVIPQIPQLDVPDMNGVIWRLKQSDATIKWIKFTLESPEGKKLYVVIDRTQPSIG